jgi:hypothetical protein
MAALYKGPKMFLLIERWIYPHGEWAFPQYIFLRVVQHIKLVLIRNEHRSKGHFLTLLDETCHKSSPD